MSTKYRTTFFSGLSLNTIHKNDKMTGNKFTDRTREILLPSLSFLLPKETKNFFSGKETDFYARARK
jgi:hypothetical protein